MPFTIPNAADAEDVSQAQPDSRDFRDILVPAFAGTGVVSGCAVTAQGSPNMTVAVAGGSVAVGGTVVGVSGGNVTITAANPTNPRFDLIVADAAGVKSAVVGTPAAAPVFPDPAGKVVLAAVRVPASVTFITSQKIVDKRVAPAATSQQLTPTGAVSAFAGAAAPVGWLLCDGQAYSRSIYATLFALVGTTYGVGDGSTTFNIPDIRGRIAVGLGTHADVNALGKSDGVATVANRRVKHQHTNGLTLPAHIHSHSFTLPAHIHNHTFTLPNHAHTNTLALPNHIHSHTFTLPDHVHTNSFTLPNHVHAHTFTLPLHVHAHTLTLPDHAHSHSLSIPNHTHNITDPGHTHGVYRNVDQSGGPYPPAQGPIGSTSASASATTGVTVGNPPSLPAVNGSVNGATSVPNISGGVADPTTTPTINGGVANPTTTPGLGGSIGNPATSPNINGAVGNPTSLPGLSGSVDNPTTNPTIVGAVGNPSTTPGIDGAIGNPSTSPAINGTIGDVGMVDSAAYITLNYIIKT